MRFGESEEEEIARILEGVSRERQTLAAGFREVALVGFGAALGAAVFGAAVVALILEPDSRGLWLATLVSLGIVVGCVATLIQARAWHHSSNREIEYVVPVIYHRKDNQRRLRIPLLRCYRVLSESLGSELEFAQGGDTANPVLADTLECWQQTDDGFHGLTLSLVRDLLQRLLADYLSRFGEHTLSRAAYYTPHRSLIPRDGVSRLDWDNLLGGHPNPFLRRQPHRAEFRLPGSGAWQLLFPRDTIAPGRPDQPDTPLLHLSSSRGRRWTLQVSMSAALSEWRLSSRTDPSVGKTSALVLGDVASVKDLELLRRRDSKHKVLRGWLSARAEVRSSLIAGDELDQVYTWLVTFVNWLRRDTHISAYLGRLEKFQP